MRFLSTYKKMAAQHKISLRKHLTQKSIFPKGKPRMWDEKEKIEDSRNIRMCREVRLLWGGLPQNATDGTDREGSVRYREKQNCVT